MNVLIVDDQRLSRARLIQLIDWQGLGIRLAGEAANGREALEMIGDAEADLVVTDVRMPVMSGLQLIEQAREQYGDDIGFVVTSGYDEFEYVRQSLRLTVADYLLKPVDGAELNAVLGRLIELRREQTARHAAMLRQRQEQWLYYVVEDVFEGDPELLEAEAVDAGFAGDGRVYAAVALGPEAGAGLEALAAAVPEEAVRIVIRTRGVWLAAVALQAGLADAVRQSGGAAGLPPDALSAWAGKLRDLPRLLHAALGGAVGAGGGAAGTGGGAVAGAVGRANDADSSEADSISDGGTTDVRKAMLEVKAYIDHHYHETLTLTELAKRLYISPGYFCSLFRQLTGHNYLEYVAGLRMDLAKRLLTEDPGRRINEVAELCGYQDLKYFRKLFKRHHGMTPMKLKEEAQLDKARDS